MNIVEDTKVCPLCAETIKSAARVCPWCQSRFDWSARLDLAWFMVIVIALVACIFVVLWNGLGIKSKFSGRSFSPDRSQLSVIRTSLDSLGVGSKSGLSGFVTNQGDHPWRVRELEVRFLGAGGELLDVVHPSIKDSSFVVQPGREHAFRIDLGVLAVTNPPGGLRVRVQVAEDGNYPSQD